MFIVQAAAAPVANVGGTTTPDRYQPAAHSSIIIYHLRIIFLLCGRFHALPGTAVKESTRPKTGGRPSLHQRLRRLGGSVRCLARGIVAAIERTLTWQLNRLVGVRRSECCRSPVFFKDRRIQDKFRSCWNASCGLGPGDPMRSDARTSDTSLLVGSRFSKSCCGGGPEAAKPWIVGRYAR